MDGDGPVAGFDDSFVTVASVGDVAAVGAGSASARNSAVTDAGVVNAEIVDAGVEGTLRTV